MNRKVKITWSDGGQTFTDESVINKFIALYGAPNFTWEFV